MYKIFQRRRLVREVRRELRRAATAEGTRGEFDATTAQIREVERQVRIIQAAFDELSDQDSVKWRPVFKCNKKRLMRLIGQLEAYTRKWAPELERVETEKRRELCAAAAEARMLRST